jgi:short-subunit dehydrogenase
MKKAIIIGASSGIGRHLALLLADQGYQVAITGRRTHLLQELQASKPTQFISKTFDVTDLNNPQHLDQLASQLTGLDLLVISSGIGEINEKLDFSIEKSTIDVNVSGFTQVADWAFNYFYQQGKGHLVNISSIAGIRGARHAPAYNASKAYQINYLEGLRQKANRVKAAIIITDVRPGFVNTAMAKGEDLFWVASVEKAAKQIMIAIEKNQKIIYVTRRWRMIGVMLKFLPGWIYEKF